MEENRRKELDSLVQEGLNLLQDFGFDTEAQAVKVSVEKVEQKSDKIGEEKEDERLNVKRLQLATIAVTLLATGQDKALELVEQKQAVKAIELTAKFNRFMHRANQFMEDENEVMEQRNKALRQLEQEES